jgi:succinate dehydrogenase/fumarate reductase flavoprotein subunit
VRDAELLEESTSECSWLRNQQLHDVTVSNSDELLRVLETDNLVFTADLMAKAALHRTESRGSHYREDFPDRSDKDLDHNVFWSMDDSGEAQPTAGRYLQDPNESTQVTAL